MKLGLVILLFSISAIAKDGRYQLVTGSKFEDDRLLDSQTGKIWKRSCAAIMKKAGVCSAYVWKPEPVIGLSTDKEYQEYIEREQSVAKSADESMN